MKKSAGLPDCDIIFVNSNSTTPMLKKMIWISYSYNIHKFKIQFTCQSKRSSPICHQEKCRLKPIMYYILFPCSAFYLHCYHIMMSGTISKDGKGIKPDRDYKRKWSIYSSMEGFKYLESCHGHAQGKARSQRLSILHYTAQTAKKYGIEK